MYNVIVLDTETTNDIESPLMYDLGFSVVDIESGEVLDSVSLVIAEVFLNKELMSSAFFAEKIPMYWVDIKSGKRQLTSYFTAKKALAEICDLYNVKAIVAHNARFDYKSCSCTIRYLTKSKYRYFLPYGIEIWDSLKMSREVFKTEEYKTFCVDNGFVTKRNQPKYTAEVIYRYLTKDINFIESHTALEDVNIETLILLECIKQGCVNRKLW